MQTNCYDALPEGYKESYHIDARKKKTGLIFNGIAFLVLAVVLAVVLPTTDWSFLQQLSAMEFLPFMGTYLLYMAIFFCSMLVYLVLHELTHGVVYKAMTKKKLTFGISWSCAFCGVPDAYVTRKTAIYALLAPFVTFTLVFLPLTILFAFESPPLYLLFGFLLGMHVGGCSGDLFVFGLLTFRFKDKSVLIRDTGPEQWIYEKE